ncbi:MAG: Galactokinase, partial [Frankiales bacterium]|nr:Galactokinase [Frankiales bacterium]
MQVQQRGSALADVFRRELSAEPGGVWAAPGRVNLLGEHTDYNDGWVLPAAIDREVLAAVRLRDDGVFRCRSLDLPGTVTTTADGLGPGRASGWSAYVLGVVWALREAGLDVPGVDVLLSSDVPAGAGLSSSAALEAAVCLALVDLSSAPGGPALLDRTAMATVCRRAETDVVGAPVGIMDQTASLRGRAGSALLLDCRSLQVQHVALDLAARGLTLLVLDTRVHHAHATGEYAARRTACDQAAAALGVPALRDATEDDVETRLTGELQRCARHVVTEDDRVLRVVDALAAGDLDEVGRLFAASHASMRDDFRISCPELDTAVAASVSAGAVAARMTGGGFGGCAVALVPRGAE